MRRDFTFPVWRTTTLCIALLWITETARLSPGYAQAVVTPPELAGVEVLYFKKVNDNPVIRALNSAGVPWIPRSSPADVAASETDTLTCTPDVSAEAIKKIATLVLDAGIKLTVIEPSIFSGQIARRITLEKYTGGDDLPTLSRELVASRCPTSELSMLSPRPVRKADQLNEADRQSLRRRATPTKDQVLACLGSGYQTVREMYVCSGGMFTPELLSSCILGGSCDHGLPASAFDGFLSGRQETWTQSLTLTSPSVDANAVVKCVSTQPETEANKCFDTQIYPQPSPEISACGAFNIDPDTADALARCVVSRLGSPWNTVVTCILGSQGNNATACIAPLAPDLAQQIGTIRDCLERAGPEISRESLRCLVVLLPEEHRPLATCILADDFSNTSRKLQCLGTIPVMRPAVSVISCASPDQSASGLALSCAAALGHPISPQVRTCLQNSSMANCLPGDPTAGCVVKYSTNPAALITCLTQQDLELQNWVRVSQCVLNAGNPSDFVSACLPVDEKIRVPVACALQQTTKEALLACVAAAYLNADQRRLLGCAMSSQSYLEFAICYTGMKLTREQAVLIKCLGQFGPTPQGAGCAAGKLTIDELEKCRRGIGTSDGCFGPNNGVLQAFRQLSEISLSAPGIARDSLAGSIQLAVHNVEQVGNSVRELANGLDACAHNPGQCGPVVTNFCQNNPIACATVLPIPGRPSLPSINLNFLNIRAVPTLPAPSCNLQWKCESWQCRNICG
jgi:hypothetical protein